MIDFDDIKEAVSDFIDEKPLLFRIALLIVIFFLIALIIIFIQSSPKKQNIPYKKDEIMLTSEPVMTDGPNIEKDYYSSRTTENVWSETQLKEWFTSPDGKLSSGLEKANDKIVSDIIGAAP